MECQLANRTQVIEDYLDKRLSEEEAEAFTNHYFNCDVCHEELRMREEMQDLIRTEGNVIFAEYLKTRRVKQTKFSLWFFDELFRSRRKFIYGLAVAAGVIIIMLVGPQILKQLGERGERFVEANFQESPNLEDLINTTYRQPHSITVLSPPNGANIKDQALFRWQTPYSGMIYWKLLNNKEEVLFSHSTRHNEYLLDKASEKLRPGLYYWKLETDDELLHVGKFYIR